MRRPIVLAATALLLICSGALPGFAADAPSGKQLSNGCTACHGLEGRGGEAIPTLAGQSTADLMTKLHDFRDQKGDATIMNRIARGYTDAEIQALADYFSSIK